eukprot:364173-Chlamydomonas_euryale.AAC.13
MKGATRCQSIHNIGLRNNGLQCGKWSGRTLMWRRRTLNSTVLPGHGLQRRHHILRGTTPHVCSSTEHMQHQNYASKFSHTRDRQE